MYTALVWPLVAGVLVGLQVFEGTDGNLGLAMAASIAMFSLGSMLGNIQIYLREIIAQRSQK